MSKPNTVTIRLKITNCLNCPHSKTITSQYTGDSFDMIDQDVVCMMVKGQEHRGQHERVEGQPIVCGERHNLRSYCGVPDWCPLLKRKKA